MSTPEVARPTDDAEAAAWMTERGIGFEERDEGRWGAVYPSAVLAPWGKPESVRISGNSPLDLVLGILNAWNSELRIVVGHWAEMPAEKRALYEAHLSRLGLELPRTEAVERLFEAYVEILPTSAPFNQVRLLELAYAYRQRGLAVETLLDDLMEAHRRDDIWFLSGRSRRAMGRRELFLSDSVVERLGGRRRVSPGFLPRYVAFREERFPEVREVLR